MSTPGAKNDPCRQDDPVCTMANGKAYAMCVNGKWADKCQCVVPGSNPSTGSGAGSGSMSTGSAARCGDGAITAPSEACDGGNLNGATCQSLGYMGGGTLSCNPTTCNYDIFMCRMTTGTGSGAGTSGGAGNGGGGRGS